VQEAEYVERAKQRIREILDTEHAVVRAELEARISEAGFPGSGLNIDPHHATRAFNDLRWRNREILQTNAETTRGEYPVATIQPTNQRRRTTAITKAAQRRRLLYGRYLGWAHGDKRRPNGLLGPAGEQAVRAGLLESGRFQPEPPDASEVSKLLNTELPGPLDSGGYSITFTNGLPQPPITVLIEVKNIRSWVYPQSAEPYQLLHKSCILQQTHPEQPILPVLICRKAHPTTFWMAKQLGFMVIQLRTQFAGAVDEKALNEVRTELHFEDLRFGSEASTTVRDRFRDVIPLHGPTYAAAWQKTAANPELVHSITQLRYAREDRDQVMSEFRKHVKRAGHRGF